MRAVIERDVNAFFSSREQERFTFWIFANCIYDLPRRYSLHDLSPRFAAVVRREDVWTQIVDPQRVNCRISGVRVEMSSFNERNLLPRGSVRRRHIAPGFSTIGCEMNQTVVGAAPDPVRVER